MKQKNYFSAIIFLLNFTVCILFLLPDSNAQISYSQDFSNQSQFNGLWKLDGNTASFITEGCPSLGMTISIKGDTTRYFTSPNLQTSNGGPVEFNFDYKIYRRSGPGTYGVPDTFGTISVQWATSAGGPWVTSKVIGRGEHGQLNQCYNKSAFFTPPVGGDVYVRFEIKTNTRNDTYWFIFDNIVVTQGPYCATTSTYTDTTCDSLVLNGKTYTQSGIYVDTLVNAGGCDSFQTINLTIKGISSLSYVTDTGCNSYDFNGKIYTQSGVYYDTLVKPSGCDSIVILDLTVNQTVAGGITNDLQKLVSDDQAERYQWLDCDNNYAVVPGEQSKQFTPTISGSYAVEITNNDCSDTSACVEFIVPTDGIQYLGADQHLRIYPNPAGDYVYVYTGQSRVSAIRIIHMTGQLLQSIPVTQIQDEYRLDISGYQPGFYFIEIHEPSGSTKVKLIKQ